MSYVRPDESARLSYDMIKNGTFAKAIQQGMAGDGRGDEMPDLEQNDPRRQAAGILGLRQVPVAGRQLERHG